MRRLTGMTDGGIIVALGVAAALAACGPVPVTPSSTAPPGASAEPLRHPTGALDVVVQVAWWGGLPNWSTQYQVEMPQVTIYGDGTFVTGDGIFSAGDGTFVTGDQRRTGSLTEAVIGVLLETARGSGLLDAGRIDYPGDTNVNDAMTFHATIVTNRRHEVSAYGLGFEEHLEPAIRGKRAGLRAFLVAILSAVAAASSLPYAPGAVRVWAGPSGEHRFDPARQPVDWPLAPGLAERTPGLTEDDPLACFVLTGADAISVLDAAGDADEGTPWVSGGRRYSVLLRPLLPHESGCPPAGG